MFRDNERKGQSVETVIGESVHVEGNFVGDGDVRIEGKVTGSIKTSGNLRIGARASIKADVEAASIHLSGRIQGNVTAKEHLECTDSARIRGNIATKALTVATGAALNGKVTMKVEGTDDDQEQVSQQTRTNKTTKSQ